MKTIKLLLFTLLIGALLWFQFSWQKKSNDSYIGKCYQLKEHSNDFIKSVVIKIDKIREDGRLNVIIVRHKEPKTPEEIYLSAVVKTYNNSWIVTEDFKDFNEVNCN